MSKVNIVSVFMQEKCGRTRCGAGEESLTVNSRLWRVIPKVGRIRCGPSNLQTVESGTDSRFDINTPER